VVICRAAGVTFGEDEVGWFVVVLPSHMLRGARFGG
jgi:hypothetical protein